MPITLNDTVIMGDDGKFTPDFSPEMLGEQYKDSKFFETTPDIVALMKTAVDSKSALGRKLENVIQKPGSKATDQEKLDYQKALKKELGAPDSIDAYPIDASDGPDGDKEYTTTVKQAFLDEGIPVSSAVSIAKKVDAYVQNKIKAENQKLEEAFNVQIKAFQDSHKGDKLVVGMRTAIKAMVQFGTPELVKVIKESKILTNPNDFSKLRDIGIWPSQLAIWENIGTAMKSDQAITNEGDPISGHSKGPEAGTAEHVISKAYDHPTSVADRKMRGKTY